MLAALVAGGRASLAVLLPYALCWGAIQAFVGPSRDAMVSHVVSGALLRAITGITLVQFLSLAVGAQLGGLTGIIGSGANLALQAGSCCWAWWPCGSCLGSRRKDARPAPAR